MNYCLLHHVTLKLWLTHNDTLVPDIVDSNDTIPKNIKAFSRFILQAKAKPSQLEIALTLVCPSSVGPSITFSKGWPGGDLRGYLWGDLGWPNQTKPNQTKPNQPKPNPTNTNQTELSCWQLWQLWQLIGQESEMHWQEQPISTCAGTGLLGRCKGLRTTITWMWDVTK